MLVTRSVLDWVIPGHSMAMLNLSALPVRASLFRLRRSLLRLVAILRDRLSRQNDRCVSRGRTEIGTGPRLPSRLASGNYRRFLLAAGFGLRLGPVIALIGTAAATATTTAASTPAPRSLSRFLVFAERSFHLCGSRIPIAWCSKVLDDRFGFLLGLWFVDRGRAFQGMCLFYRLGLTQVHSRARRGNLPEFLFPFFFTGQLQEVGNVKKRVPLQPDINERRLHAGKHARDTAFVDGSCEGVLIFPLEKDFGELIVLHQRHFGFVWRGGHVKFLIHGAPVLPARSSEEDRRHFYG